LVDLVIGDWRLVIVAALLLSAACAPADAPARLATTTLAIEGRANATPSIASLGSFVAVAWGASAQGQADVFVAVSRDGGATFAGPVRVNAEEGEARLGGELPPRVALHRSSTGEDPDVTVLWTARGVETSVKIARSTDGGRTFGVPSMLQAGGAIGDRGWPALSVGGDGVAHAVWLDHRELASSRAGAGAHAGHRTAGAHDGVAMAQKSALYYARIGPAAPAPEARVTNGVCYCCKTALAAGPDGRLLAAWRHVYPGSFRDIALSASTDGGRTFSDPIRVHEDGWSINGCPDDGPALAAGADGTFHLIWPTVLQSPRPQGALFYATTKDGAAITKPVRIPTLGGEKPAHPQIAIDGRGRVVVAWDEHVNDARVSALRELLPGREVRFGQIVTLGETGAYPVVAGAPDGLVAAWTSGSADASAVVVRRLALP
jgi:hypothetical protein